MAIGYIGGFFHGLGGPGMANVVGGAIADALIHGAVTSKLADWLATKNATTPESEYNKADLLISLMAAVPIGTFGALRLTKYDYESDMLDFVGNCFGGAMIYEACNSFEVLSSLVKEL